MPHIPATARLALKRRPPETPGELNYVLTQTIRQYVDTRGLSYGTINDVIGALEGCKLEFYRLEAGPYEDGAIARNGSVYVERHTPSVDDGMVAV